MLAEKFFLVLETLRSLLRLGALRWLAPRRISPSRCRHRSSREAAFGGGDCGLHD